MVTLRVKSFFSVTRRPPSSSHSANVLMMLRMVMLTTAPRPDLEVHHHAFDHDPDDGHRNQDLPAETHDLVVAVARERGAEPEEQEQEEEQSCSNSQWKPSLSSQPSNGIVAQRSVRGDVAVERAQPAAEEEHRGQRRDQDHVGVFGQEEQRERDAGIFHVEAGDDFRLAFGHVERRAIGLGDARDEIDDEQREQPEPVPGEEAALLLLDDVAEVQTARGHDARRPARSPWRFRRRRSARPSAWRRGTRTSSSTPSPRGSRRTRPPK